MNTHPLNTQFFSHFDSFQSSVICVIWPVIYALTSKLPYSHVPSTLLSNRYGLLGHRICKSRKTRPVPSTTQGPASACLEMKGLGVLYSFHQPIPPLHILAVACWAKTKKCEPRFILKFCLKQAMNFWNKPKISPQPPFWDFITLLLVFLYIPFYSQYKVVNTVANPQKRKPWSKSTRLSQQSKDEESAATDDPSSDLVDHGVAKVQERRREESARIGLVK